MEAALFETLSGIHAHAMQDDDIEPCCECGKDSKGYMYFDDDETFMCEECDIIHS
jgi:hypothetical protein